MKVFIIGATGGVGGRIAEKLRADDHEVTAIVRSPDKAQALSDLGVIAKVADLVEDSVETLADAMRGSEIVVFTAGAGGKNGDDMTTRVDGDGPGKASEAAAQAGIRRFYLVSVFPDAWRDRGMDQSFEHYMAEKKKAETRLVLTDLDWVILRPSALKNDPGTGTVDLGLSKIHEEIRRDDVADTLIALMGTPGVNRVILEATEGSTPIAEAVAGLRV